MLSKIFNPATIQCSEMILGKNLTDFYISDAAVLVLFIFQTFCCVLLSGTVQKIALKTNKAPDEHGFEFSFLEN